MGDLKGIYWERVPDLVKYALSLNIINEHSPTLEIIQIDLLKRRIIDLISGFNSFGRANFKFAFAIKAHTFTKILEIFRDLGCGAECASYGEVLQAIKCGFDPTTIIFDSPCKSATEIKRSIYLGICINADNFDELMKIDEIFGNDPILYENYKSTIGLRINPQLRAGEYMETSTATKTAHFGVPLIGNEEKIVNVFRKYNWLNGLHLHMGSQGICIDLLLDGIKSIYDLAVDVNNKVGGKIKIVDIGGGLPIGFDIGEDLYPYKKYAEAIQTKMPNFFNGDFMIYTEFGNSATTKCGFTLTKVEYVKNCGDVNTIIGHIGVHYGVGNYDNDGTNSRILLLNSNGEIKSEEQMPYRIVGPLCFAGDIIKSHVMIPEAFPGDYLLILDTGSYYSSWYARINSIPRPPIIGIYQENDTYKHLVVYKGETYEDILKLWE